MPKPDKTEALTLEQQLEEANQRIADLGSQLNLEKERADNAEAELKKLHDEIAAGDPEAEHVAMKKGQEVIHIHPATVEAHKTAGWKRV